MNTRDEPSLLVQIACVWEALARKVGNVSRCSDFAKTHLNDFLLSALAVPDNYSNGVGLAVWNAVRSTNDLVGQNTNLGIHLLIAPLAATERSTRNAIDRVLQALTVEDAVNVFRAIRLANPGGLGDAPREDVRSEPTLTLLEAMKLAADRDLIARQYANGFADVLDLGVPALKEGFEKFGCVEAAIVHSQLCWLSTYPDSLIARKNGIAVAEDVQKRAAAVAELGGIATREGRRAGAALDQHLRSDGNRLNPGTTADLVAASLFVALREESLRPTSPFNWQTDEWL